jgi:hypothetical protein
MTNLFERDFFVLSEPFDIIKRGHIHAYLNENLNVLLHLFFNICNVNFVLLNQN